MPVTKEQRRLWTSSNQSGRSVVNCAVAVPPDIVWKTLSDGWLYSQWVVGAVAIRDVDSTWPKQGSRIHHSVGIWPLLIDDDTEVMEAVPNERLVLRARAWPIGETTVDIRLVPNDTGTDVSLLESAESGRARLLPRAVRQKLFSVRNSESLQRLALIAEGRR